MRTLTPLLLMLVACAGGDRFGLSRANQPANELVYNNATEPETIDPGQATGHPDSRIIGEIFDGLTEYDPVDLTARPSIATHWDVHPDGRGYTFHLRDNAVWSDGVPVTADDFLYSWERVLNPVHAARFSSMLYAVHNAQLYNTGRIGRLTAEREGFASGTPMELLTSNAWRLDAETPVTGADGAVVATLPEGQLVVGTIEGDQLAIRFGVECSLDDLAALLDCDPVAQQGRIPRSAASDALPRLDARVVTRTATLTGRGGALAELEKGDLVTVLSWADADPWVLYATDSQYGSVPADALADPRAAHVKYEVRPLPEPNWGGALAEPEDTAVPPDAPPGGAPLEGQAPDAEDLSTAWVGLGDLRLESSLLGLKVHDPHTFEVRLGGVAPYFLQQTSHTTLRAVPRQAVEVHGPRWTRVENIVTNGPFLLKEHKMRDKFVLERNPDWWGTGELSLDRITAYSVDNLHTSANLYKAGYTDFVVANDLPTEFIPLLKTKTDFHTAPALSVYLYRLNTNEPPLDDARVRRALAMAIRRDDVVSILKAGQVPANHIVPPGLPGYEGMPGPDFDPEAARALLAEAGYPDGEGFPEISIVYNTSESHKLVAAVVQANWKEHLGIDVKLRNQEWKTYLKTVQNMDFDVARGGWIGDYLDPNTFLDLWVENGGNNNTGWTNPEFDRLIEAAGKEPDPEERMRKLAEAEAILNEEMPFIPMYWYVWAELQQPDVKGLHPNLMDQHPLRWVSLDR
ncbi:MAG: peptide ABC transporter substrate-binding protein [Deltaproteobacteria bacterium]|nr:MAG: peptide ABC transporter substrate-binding protein [Deltaproteobacteria bacterium]